MPPVVTVSSIERTDTLRTYINELFDKDRYAEIVQAIGMHSILVDPEHMIHDQEELYRLVLNLLKKKIIRDHPALYSPWLTAFPSLLAGIVKEGRTITDDAAHSALVSRHAAFGPFTSVDEFYFWALEDRRLPLEHIVRYVMATIERQKQ